MAPERASKRRKITSDAAPLPVVSEGTSHETNGDASVGKSANGARRTPTNKKRARQSDAVTSPAVIEGIDPITSTNGNGHVESNGGAVHDGGIHANGKALAKKGRVSKGQTSEDSVVDIEMEDAPSVAAASQADSADMDTPRTSGRRRQKSRKHEDTDTISVATSRASPSTGRARKAPAKQTPSKRSKAIPVPQTQVESPGEVLLAVPTPVGRRKGASSTPKRAADTVISDSEPENAENENDSARDDVTTTQPPEPSPILFEEHVEPHSVPDTEPAPHTNGQPMPPVTPKKRDSSKAPQVPTQQPMVVIEAPQAASHALVSLNLLDVAEDATASAATELSSDDTMFTSDELLQIQEHLVQKVTRKLPSKLVGLDTETKKVVQLMQQTITAGESNSMVVIGARGSGKTTMVESILEEQRAKHGDDFHVVRLSGFVHTDDRIAIREIWRQLGREMEIEEDSNVKTHADTMTTLLALLSHPSETGHAEEGRIAKSVIIILDEFDLFTTHPRQTLLYNLFDIAQSRKAPLAVLGLTTRYDVAEALEKRVKSRFSHRQVYLPLAKNFAAYKEMCKAVLSVADTQSDLSGRWNAFIASLLDVSTVVNSHLQSLYHSTKSIPALQTSLLLPLGTLDALQPLSAGEIRSHLESALTLCPPLTQPDSNLTLLPSLSSLELALLICAARLLIIHDSDAASFPLAYDEYKSLASKARIAASAAGALATARVWGQGVARLAWEGLVDKGLVIPVGERARGGAGVCRIDIGLEEIGGAVDAGLEAGNMGRWCKEI